MSRITPLVLGAAMTLVACERTPAAPSETNAWEQGGAPVWLASSEGLTQTTWPSPADPGPPYYARIEPTVPHIPIVDGWAVIAFYRDPGCIPPDFNLLRLFNPPAAFGCPLTVAGFNLWSADPFTRPPMVAWAHGTGAVPFWFVPAAAAIVAMEDGVLTIGELAGLDGRLEGSAAGFVEMLQPFGGGAPTPKLVQQAQGALADERAFQYHVTTLLGETQAITLHFD